MGHRRSVILQLGAVGVVLVLAACSGSTAGDTTPSTTSAVTTAVTPVIDAQAEAFLALDTGEQEAELAALTATLERDLMTASGLEDELGGAAAADTAFAALTAAMIDQAEAFRADSAFGRFGARPVAGDEISLGGLMFAGWLVAGLGAEGIVGATNDAKPGKTETTTQSQGTDTVNLTGSLDTASLDATVEKTIDGITGKLHVKVDISPCPDASGQFTSTITMDASATSAAGRTGSNVSQVITVVGQVGDDAELASYDVSTRSQAAKFGAGKGSYVDVTNSSTYTGGKLTAYDRSVNRSAGGATAEMAEEWSNAGTMTEMLVNKYALQAAEKAWKSGRCVDLQVATSPGKRGGLKPSTPVSITASPRSKVDGAPAGGTVAATLSGDSSIDPAGSPVPADASFAYVAPGEKDMSASVSLEARSRRGIGKAEVSFNTTGVQAYSASGGADMFHGSGTICDLSQPFTLAGSGVTVRFVPSSATGGSYSYSGKISSFAVMGQGTYVAKADESGGTIVATGPGSVATPMGTKSANGTEKYALTPVAPCE